MPDCGQALVPDCVIVPDCGQALVPDCVRL